MANTAEKIKRGWGGEALDIANGRLEPSVVPIEEGHLKALVAAIRARDKILSEVLCQCRSKKKRSKTNETQ